MADTVLTASAERHHEAFEELLSEVEEYNPEVDRDLLERWAGHKSDEDLDEYRRTRNGHSIDGLPAFAER